ncbi:hypothetical protein [Noviherbaspirillum suwonense]|uniref:Uncharacterized protein n=1 Tax=Noviherbaspirillum suwonense TaxID=1224511 RepID=A0ABY1QXM7_9BURK|nr:hypothetical protein [Noviherbaspirillum suwonense]SMP82277.1 hypothetical protein SAMN06295970_1571 [Noviherbaspirillum suwonense]
MNTPPTNPISVKSLWENSWVFALYGLCLGLSIGIMENFDVNFAKAEMLMMEPLSFYAFSFLSIFGLLGLAIINIATSKSAAAMYSSAWVMRFWVPISNAGLSTGAIVMGMMFGLAIGLMPWVGANSEVRQLVKMLFTMSGFVGAILYPLTWMKRSLFDLTKQEEYKSVVAGILYCLTLFVAFWFIDQQKFWRFLLVLSAASLVAGFIIRKLSKKRS